jgi:ribonuclease HI
MEIISLIIDLEKSGMQINFTKVKAHTGSLIGNFYGNDRADKLADEGAKKNLEL